MVGLGAARSALLGAGSIAQLCRHKCTDPLTNNGPAADLVTTLPPCCTHAPPPTRTRAWIALVGMDAARSKANVCIGSTSARACEAAGLSNILFPEYPGIEGWVECVLQAMGQPQQQGVAA